MSQTNVGPLRSTERSDVESTTTTESPLYTCFVVIKETSARQCGFPRDSHCSPQQERSPSRPLRRPHQARGSRQLRARHPTLLAVPCPGHCFRYCRLRRDQRCIFRNGVIEHVLLQTAQTPSLSQRVPATQNKKPPCNNTWWTEIKRTVQSLPLCLHRE